MTETRRKIPNTRFGKWYRCRGTMTDAELQAAAENRERVANNYGAEYWNWLAAVIKSSPTSRLLPSCVPLGSLPEATTQGRTNRQTWEDNDDYSD